MQKNVEYIVLEKINRCADCGRRLIGKTGVNPAQSRYCKGKFTAICHWETGKAQLNVEPEPGDLPVTGILHLREIGGYLHRLFIYALSREGIFILKGGLRMCKEMILVTGGARSGKSEFAERFVLQAARKTEKLVVFVTNEVGGGIVPDNVMAREYRDLAGWINQQVADVCDRVFYCVAGQAVDLKKMAFSFDDEGAEQWKK